jgi:hypothetical protein
MNKTGSLHISSHVTTFVRNRLTVFVYGVFVSLVVTEVAGSGVHLSCRMGS